MLPLAAVNHKCLLHSTHKTLHKSIPPAATASLMWSLNRSTHCCRSSPSRRKTSTSIKAPPGRRQRAACARKRALPSWLRGRQGEKGEG